MPKNHNQEVLVRIGIQIKELRKRKSLRIADVSSRTGFSESTISAIENGRNTDTNHLLAIAKAIKVHPKEFFNIEFHTDPITDFKNPEKTNAFLTYHLADIVRTTDFFSKPHLVNEIREYLKEERNIDATSTHVSVVLKRLVNESILKIVKQGRKNLYSLINYSPTTRKN